MQAPVWDVFCRVIDNWGDVGVSWRLAADLAARGQRVRLWLDDTAPLAWMAPDGAPGVEVLPWNAAVPGAGPGEVVVETFGCDAPADFLAAMARMPRPPVWINLEYLSAEDYVERSHRLPSPQQAGPARGLVKWFFYPGFTERTGGLLREPGLLEERAAFEGRAWLAQRLGLRPAADALCVSLFCYDNTALPALVQAWRDGTRPVHLLATPGLATRALERALGATATGPLRRGALAVDWLPYLAQRDYDRLLWSCDLNFVRGEDSLVRAIWAARPFVWQPYVQEDDAHLAKLEAFLRLVPDAGAWQVAERAWNRQQALDWPPLAAALPGITTALGRLGMALSGRPDLATALIAFAAEKRAAEKR